MQISYLVALQLFPGLGSSPRSRCRSLNISKSVQDLVPLALLLCDQANAASRLIAKDVSKFRVGRSLGAILYQRTHTPPNVRTQCRQDLGEVGETALPYSMSDAFSWEMVVCSSKEWLEGSGEVDLRSLCATDKMAFMRGAPRRGRCSLFDSHHQGKPAEMSRRSK
jgi:hypothetical protein